jgi:hypothetical protein
MLAMSDQMNNQSKTKRTIVAAVAVAMLGIAAPLAFADSIGAPTSAAGGVSAPSGSSLPSAAGPIDRGSGFGGASSFDESDSSQIQRLQPGTGKFEGPRNGTDTPCIGTTGFGSSRVVPGLKC